MGPTNLDVTADGAHSSVCPPACAKERAENWNWRELVERKPSLPSTHATGSAFGRLGLLTGGLEPILMVTSPLVGDEIHVKVLRFFP